MTQVINTQNALIAVTAMLFRPWLSLTPRVRAHTSTRILLGHGIVQAVSGPDRTVAPEIYVIMMAGLLAKNDVYVLFFRPPPPSRTGGLSLALVAPRAPTRLAAVPHLNFARPPGPVRACVLRNCGGASL